ncbi:MAG: ATP-binding protein [Verrucomicrobiota bacterium]|jgi:two-component system sensor histidine kinase KdpD
MNEKMQAAQTQQSGKPEQRLLVAVAPGLVSEQLVHWTHRLARSLDCPWGAIYVDDSAILPEQDQLQLARTLAVARALGAEVVTTSDPDLARGLLRSATERGVTQIVLSQPTATSYGRLFRRGKLLKKLLRESGTLDIHVVHFKEESSGPVFSPARSLGSTWREYLVAAAIICAVSWVMTYTRTLMAFQAVAWVFLAAVVLMAPVVGRGATLLAAVMSALLWDYYFEPPIHSFSILAPRDQFLFGMFILIAVVLGQLTAKIRRQEKVERERKERAEALQRLTREVTEAAGYDDMLAQAVRQTAFVFKAPVALILPSSSGEMSLHPVSTFQVTEEEIRVAAWVHERGLMAGRFTADFPLATALYLPLSAYGAKWGVMALQLSQAEAPTIHQRTLMDAFAEQIAMAIQRCRMQEISEKSKLLAESERLSKTLLNSISHEVRTPLTVIQSAADCLADFPKPGASISPKAMIAEIQEAAKRLNRLVGKVIEATRLETGHVQPKFEPCEVGELVQVVEEATLKELAHHKVRIKIASNLPPVPMDFELMVHALANLLSNAAFHTPAGTEVQLLARVEDVNLLLVVADNGPGIPPESIPRLFEKFYRAPGAPTGGTGLGLSLVKGFVEAQGGQVTVENRPEGGAAFTIRLPLKQISTPAGCVPV